MIDGGLKSLGDLLFEAEVGCSFLLSLLAVGKLANNPIRKICFACFASSCRSTLPGNLLGSAQKKSCSLIWRVSKQSFFTDKFASKNYQ